jgi:hypothetical protein
MWREFRDLRLLGVALLAVFYGLVIVLNLTVFSPHATVERYLDALHDGRTEDAIDLVWPDGNEGDLVSLATDSALRPTLSAVTQTETVDGITTVTADVLLLGDTISVDFVLQRGQSWSPLSVWEFAATPTAVVTIDATPSGEGSLNGTPQSDSRRVLVPSVVIVDSASPWFEVKAVPVPVAIRGVEFIVPAAFTPTELLRNAMDDVVREYLNECATATTLAPTECPIAAMTYDRVAAGPAWAIETYPELSISADGRSWLVAGEGIARLTVSLVDYATEATVDYDEQVPFTVRGTIEGLGTASPTLRFANTQSD